MRFVITRENVEAARGHYTIVDDMRQCSARAKGSSPTAGLPPSADSLQGRCWGGSEGRTLLDLAAPELFLERSVADLLAVLVAPQKFLCGYFEAGDRCEIDPGGAI